MFSSSHTFHALTAVHLHVHAWFVGSKIAAQHSQYDGIGSGECVVCGLPSLSQHNFWCAYGREPLCAKSFCFWFSWLKDTGSMFKQKSPGRPCISEEDVEVIMVLCVWS